MAKCKTRDGFPNKERLKHDPIELTFIPSWDEEFLYLLGLEEVVQFRLELLEQIVCSKPKTSNNKGSTSKQKLERLKTAKGEHTSKELKTWKLEKTSFNPSIFTSTASESSWTSSHSAQSNQNLTKPTIHHVSSTFKTLASSVGDRKQVFETKSGRSECKTESSISTENVASTHQRKKSQQDVPPKVSASVNDSTINKALYKEQKIDKWTKKLNISNVSLGSHSSTVSIGGSSVSGCPKVTQEVLHWKNRKVDHWIESSSLPSKTSHKSE